MFEFTKFLKIDSEIVGMVALYLPKDKNDNYIIERHCNLSAPCVITNGSEEEYAKILVLESFLYAKQNGFIKCLSWFEEYSSMFYSVRHLFATNYIRWDSRNLIINL